jgi:hypothetical protein
MIKEISEGKGYRYGFSTGYPQANVVYPRLINRVNHKFVE